MSDRSAGRLQEIFPPELCAELKQVGAEEMRATMKEEVDLKLQVRRRIDRRMDEWMDGWMDGWIET